MSKLNYTTRRAVEYTSSEIRRDDARHALNTKQFTKKTYAGVPVYHKYIELTESHVNLKVSWLHTGYADSIDLDIYINIYMHKRRYIKFSYAASVMKNVVLYSKNSMDGIVSRVPLHTY